MTNSPMFSAMNQAKDAVGKAFEGVHKVVNKTADPMVQRYESLSPDVFTELVRDYGEDEVVNYIRAMEIRRVKGG